MKNNYVLSDNGAALMESFEGCKLTAYQDVRGRWTIGWGHTGPDVHQGLTITLEQAKALFRRDVAWAEFVVNSHVTVPLTQQEFDALTSFAYNCGCGHFELSTLLKMVNENKMEEAARQFEFWDYSGGRVVAGLLRRRLAEKKEFLGQA